MSNFSTQVFMGKSKQKKQSRHCRDHFFFFFKTKISKWSQEPFVLPCSLRTAWDCLQEILKLSNVSQRTFREQPSSLIATSQSGSLLLPLTNHRAPGGAWKETREVGFRDGRARLAPPGCLTYRWIPQLFPRSPVDASVVIQSWMPESFRFSLFIFSSHHLAQHHRAFKRSEVGPECHS